MANETVVYDGRLRDLEAQAFRTGRTLAEHSEQLATIREQQRTAFGNIDALGDAIGATGDRTIAQRLDTIEERLGSIDERFDAIDRQLGTIGDVLSALARAQGIDPKPAD
ncbi:MULTISPECIES: hypothetical protein [unclassified Streptomyces]|uniref:hypothetical protein n=1 Tax=unclassified Streptomyces TaxID=2593676 RepID=UPI002E2AE80B|nr:hypothetical protein [Streptomyces sp. NBC_00223]